VQYVRKTIVLVVIGFLIVIAGWLMWKYWTLLVGAGYDPTPMDKVRKMLDLAAVSRDDVVYDLGCGDGRIIRTAAMVYGARAVGIEIDPFRYLYTWLIVLLSGQTKRIGLQFGNFFKKYIGEASVIMLFLYQPTNSKLRTKLRTECKPGTRVVSYMWTFDEWDIAAQLPEDMIFLYIV
jgi:hypothetical protein